MDQPNTLSNEVVPVEEDSSNRVTIVKTTQMDNSLPLWTQVFRFLILFIISVLILASALLVANSRMPNPKLVKPLPDVLFNVFSKVSWLEHLTDVGIFLLNASAVYVVLKVFVLERHHQGFDDLVLPFQIPYVGHYINNFLFDVIDSGRRPLSLKNAYLIMIIRFLTVYTVMMVYRSVVIMMTAYPATDNHCQNPQVVEHPLLNILLTLVTLGSGAIHCGDLMFSGHTIILCLAWSIIWEYGVFLHAWIFKVFGTTILILSFYFIIASRSHYTDDVLVAAYSTVITYWAIRHKSYGAPWQLQCCIRWWPGPRCNCLETLLETDARVEGGEDPIHVFVAVEESFSDNLPLSAACDVPIAAEANPHPLPVYERSRNGLRNDDGNLAMEDAVLK